MYSEKTRHHNDHNDDADDVKNIHSFVPIERCAARLARKETRPNPPHRVTIYAPSTRIGSLSRFCLGARRDLAGAARQLATPERARSPITSAATPVSAAAEQQHHHDDNQN
jgi:hypothetical protein